MCLRSNQDPKVAVTLSNDNLSSTYKESISSTLTTSVISPTQTQASSSTSMPATTPTSNPPYFQPMGVLTVSPPAPTVYSTMANTLQQYNPVT